MYPGQDLGKENGQGGVVSWDGRKVLKASVATGGERKVTEKVLQLVGGRGGRGARCFSRRLPKRKGEHIAKEALP